MTNEMKIASIYAKFSGDTTPTAEEMYSYLQMAEDFGAAAATASIIQDGPLGSLLFGDALTTADKVTTVFNALFDRDPATTGLDYWVEQFTINPSYVNATSLASAVLRGAEANEDQTDWDYVNSYSSDLADELTAYEPTPVEQEGETFYLTHNNDVTHVPDGLEYSDYYGINTTGTVDADTYIANSSQNNGVANTLSSADEIDGGAGTDTLHAELVSEFVGGTTDYQVDVQAKTTDVEIVTFEAKDSGSNDTDTIVTSDANGNLTQTEVNANSLITVDAKYMTGLDKIGSYFSDGDLVIENLTTLTDSGVIRNTEDITITMDHTDNYNSDEDASDLTVYFDEDYLTAAQETTENSLTINLANTLAIKEGNNPISGFNSVSFFIDSYELTVDISSATSYADVVTAINDAIAADDNVPDTVTASPASPLPTYFAGTIDATDSDTIQYPAGSYAGDYTPITVVNTGVEDLGQGEFDTAQAEQDGVYFYSQKDLDGTPVDGVITTNVELTKVGRDGEGGDLVIGGKDQNLNGDTDEDQADGVEKMNIYVNGDSDQPSNLGTVSSTNQSLVTAMIMDGSSWEGANLTIRNLIGQGQELSLIDSSSYSGDFSLANNTAGQQAITTIFGAGDDVYKWQSVEDNNVDSGKTYSINMGNGDDTVTATLDGDSVDAQGESFSLSAGAGNDTVTMTSDTGTVSDETTTDLDNLNITLGAGEDKLDLNTEYIFNVNAGSDSDFVEIDADGTQTAVGINIGQWSLGDGTGTDATDSDWDARVLYEATLTIDFAGFEQTVTIDTNIAGNFIATQATINAAIIDAIDTNPELARLLSYDIQEGSNNNQKLVITSTTEGLNDLTIIVNQPTITLAAAATGTDTTISSSEYTALEAGLLQTGVVANSSVIDTDAGDGTTTEEEIKAALDTIDGNLDETGAVDATGTDYVLDSADGTDGANDGDTTSNAIVDMGTGDNDLIALDSADASADTIVFSAAWGKVSVLNFFTDQVNIDGVPAINHADSTVGNHQLDFTAFLTNQTSVSGSSESAVDVNIAFDGAAAGVAAGSALTENEVHIVTGFDGTAVAGETWEAITGNDILTAINGGATYGNLGDAVDSSADVANLVDDVQYNILFLENANNLGEYKVVYLTADDDTTVTNFTSAEIIGTVDFGESIDNTAVLV